MIFVLALAPRQGSDVLNMLWVIARRWCQRNIDSYT